MLNPRVRVRFGRISEMTQLCKLSKEYLNASLCKFVVYSVQNSETFDVLGLHVFLPLTIAELSTLKQVRFLAHPV